MKNFPHIFLVFAAAALFAACGDDGGDDNNTTTDAVDGVEQDGDTSTETDTETGTDSSTDSSIEPDLSADTDDAETSEPVPPGTPNLRYTYSASFSTTFDVRDVNEQHMWLPSGDAPDGVIEANLSSFACEKNGENYSVIAVASDGSGEIGRMEIEVKRFGGTAIGFGVLDFIREDTRGFAYSAVAECYDNTTPVIGEDSNAPLSIVCETYTDSDSEYLELTFNFDPDTDCTGIDAETWACGKVPAAENSNVSCSSLGRGPDCNTVAGCSAPAACIVQDASYCNAFPSAQGCLGASDSNCAWDFQQSNCFQTGPMSETGCNNQTERMDCLNSGCRWIGEQPCEGTTTCGDLGFDRTVCRFVPVCEDTTSGTKF